ncbi:MAG: guanylate kinase [Albidovulum sp.]|nr:guanylate kinase [Albidovulum sp.]MDE0305514.1 guanylate kinase [Albidovulum sp.]MDE0533417.1 guanylate kinase [Albidovulum sp.]
MNSSDGNKTTKRRTGMLIILSSPSGAGKTTLARRLTEWDESVKFSISATTRLPRRGEQNGREYWFKTPDEFRQMVEDGQFLECAKVFGNHYGSLKSPVEEAILEGNDIIFDIDWQGGEQIRNSAHADDTVSIFVLPPTIAELDRRLRLRGKDTEEMVLQRMAKSQDEISHWLDYEYVLINHDLDKVFQKIVTIIKTERMRRRRQIGLAEFVGLLNKEYEER